MRSHRLPMFALAQFALAVAVFGQGRDLEPADNEPRDPNKPPPIRRVAVGEQAPELYAAAWVNHEGTPTLDSFKNRVVVLFFFRTTDGSIDAVGQMNELQKKLGSAGVVVIGLTPQKRDKAETVVKDKDVKFIVGFEIDANERYQVSEFPRVMLIDRDGRLVSRFHPSDGLEARVRSQLERTPPADPKILAARLDRAKAAAKEKQFGRAYTAARDVARSAGETTTTGKAAADLMKKFEAEARKRLDEAKQAAQAGETQKAADILAELSVRFSGGALGADADTELGKLMGDVKAKKMVRAALANAKGQLSNDLAAAHERSGRYSEALSVYREVLEHYPNTEAAKVAGASIDRIDSDPNVQQTIAAQWADDEARRWLDLADRFAKVQMYDKARDFYQKVLDKHPNSVAAKSAKERLAKLPQEEPEADEPQPEEDASGT